MADAPEHIARVDAQARAAERRNLARAHKFASATHPWRAWAPGWLSSKGDRPVWRGRGRG